MIFTCGTLTVRQGQRDPHNEGAVECKTTSACQCHRFWIGRERRNAAHAPLHTKLFRNCKKFFEEADYLLALWKRCCCTEAGWSIKSLTKSSSRTLLQHQCRPVSRSYSSRAQELIMEKWLYPINRHSELIALTQEDPTRKKLPTRI